MAIHQQLDGAAQKQRDEMERLLGKSKDTPIEEPPEDEPVPDKTPDSK
jgi:hypothetical protein